MSMLKTIVVSIIFILSVAESQAQQKSNFSFFKKQKKEKLEEMYEKKHEKKGEMRPDEFFYQQRAYPDEYLDLKAYRTAFEKAQNQDEARAGAQQGFEQPWTLQGPTNIRGRVNTIAVHPTNTDIRLVGFATGGIWKTIDAGKNWKPIFDKENILAIGHIAYAPSNPTIVYVGTGDPNITGYPFIGNGVYKSTDGGETWKNIGLSETRIISKIVVHPTNPDLVYVGAMGLPFERNEHRGLYKTSDGGTSWTKAYYFSDQAGVIDIAMNPFNAQQIFIAGWDRIRNNKESIVNGPNCRIVKSNDGFSGNSAINQTVGLPATANGRIGLAYSPSNSNTVYAEIMGDKDYIKGVYKTVSGGASWSNIITNTIFTDQFSGGFGWYFGRIYATANDVYVLGVDLWRTKDNGVTWDNLTEGTDAHVDMHDFFIRGNTMYLASDGGAYTSDDDGVTWKAMEQIPSTAYYKVTTHPYGNGVYCGGAQDNGTLVGGKDNINNWKMVHGGDGFRASFTPANKKYIFTENQYGTLWISRDSAQTFQLASFGISTSDRKAWDSPYFVSKLLSNNMYFGTYRVYKNTNINNPVWSVLSEDLTDGAVFGSIFHVVSCMDESKQDTNKIFAGTSDGRVWRNTSQFPNAWTDIGLGLPKRYITSIHTSPTKDQTVFITQSGYKDNVFTPHIHKSTENGKNWKSINGNLPLFAVNDLFVLPNHADSILFAATDGGIYATINSGEFWQRLGSNMPYLPIYDIEWDEKNNLLVAATHGRAIMTYPIDSVTYKAPPLLSVSGKIQTALGLKPVRNVVVNAFVGTKKYQVKTDSTGVFRFKTTFPIGSNILIKPTKKDAGQNGLSTADILDIQKHILATKKIINTTGIVAADANKSSTISVADMVAIRKIVLGLQDTFAHGEGWRFIPQTYQFPNPQNPFSNTFPESITINSLDTSRTDLNFIGIRIGDTNESANPLLSPSSKENGKTIRRKE